jgi:prepilin peptidase CpaA
MAALAIYPDLKRRWIPNGLTVPASIAGLIFNVWVHDLANGSLFAAKGFLTGLALPLPLFMLGGVGGGDVKLLACIGAWVGPLRALSITLYAALVGAVLCLVVMIRCGRPSTLGRVGLDMHLLLMARGRLEPRPDALTVPYSLPIAVGAVLAGFIGDVL